MELKGCVVLKHWKQVVMGRSCLLVKGGNNCLKANSKSGVMTARKILEKECSY